MRKCSLLLLALAFTALSAAADGVDLHRYWDQRCESCHGHAGTFARRFLRIDDGRLVGTHHKEYLERFLHNHYLTDALVGPISAMLMAQVASPPLFSEKCAGCHGNASEFARESLLIQDGVLMARANGRKVVDYLATHGKLNPDEVQMVVRSLTRLRMEVSSSIK
ncbi:hypothetical protein [Rhodoferax ferrireducens]|uniref:hypothetical protein n=1 Tax=Rhodoferax ferrireducens TaxID=192843 RepID=UPI0013009CA4|nr:hypothetical protein [Rhodoferax ferrireducens]